MQQSDQVQQAGRSPRRVGGHRSRSGRGFSLLELLMVLAITAMFAAILFPALNKVRDEMDRFASANNLRQIGFFVTMYDRDFMNRLPYSYTLRERNAPSQLTVLYDPRVEQTFEIPAPENKWDGLGLLYGLGYSSMPEVFYAPSHTGQHQFERYANDFRFPGSTPIFGNFHYGGDVEWDDQTRRRSLATPGIVIATDSIESVENLNHTTGLNLLRGDGSVSWLVMPQDVRQSLAFPGEEPDEQDYLPLWRAIEGR